MVLGVLILQCFTVVFSLTLKQTPFFRCILGVQVHTKRNIYSYQHLHESFHFPPVLISPPLNLSQPPHSHPLEPDTVINGPSPSVTMSLCHDVQLAVTMWTNLYNYFDTKLC